MPSIIITLCFLVVSNGISQVISWDPSNFTFNPGDSYELVWQDEFENVGPSKAIIDGKPAYSPNPQNWAHVTGTSAGSRLSNFTDSIYNSYVQNDQLTIVAMNEGYQTAMLTSVDLQEFTFGVFAAKIKLPFGVGIWPAWWMWGHDHETGLNWPTVGEIDILEMYGGTKVPKYNDACSHATIHWNNESNTMNPVNNKAIGTMWQTPDNSSLHNHSLVYWTEWTSTNITIGVNEFVYFNINTTLPESINPVWAFTGKWPFRLILDISINSMPPPDNTTVWPQKMVVDWVKVYQKKTKLL